jgi:adenine-specific DNA-methyltransferase
MRFESGGYTPDEDNRWKAGKPTIDDLFARNRIQFNEDGVPMEKKYEHEESDPLYPIYCFMDPDLTGTAEHGKSEVNELLGNQHGVDTIKPVGLIKYFISTFANKNDTVMDFFAGTGTTAQAMYELSAEDGGNRRFILVQLPLPLDKDDKNARTSTEYCESMGKRPLLSEITKERIRQAGKKTRALATNTGAGDFGFRVFKLDHSNIRAWNPNPVDLEASLFDHQYHLLEGRSEVDVLYELLLKLGLDLCVPIEQRTIAGREVHAVGSGVLMACLAEQITREQVEPLAQGIIDWHKELAPAGNTTCVFRDSAFENDVAKTNLAAILEQHGIQNVRSL